jgi:site-specific DNA-methyltransferase (adenine-specific)
VIHPVLYNSKKDEWPTPFETFASLDCRFHFQLDPCATAENAKCKKFFTKEDDGLIQNWKKYRVFCNPPFTRGQAGKWARKAYEAAQVGALVVLLVPARTGTKWFQDWVQSKADELVFLRGRLKFGDAENSAPFDSAIAVYGKRHKGKLMVCQCGEFFLARRADRKFCSGRCRQAAYDNRNRKK